MLHPTFIVFMLNIAIVVICGVIGVMLSNPLAMLGLFFLQNIPIFEQEPENSNYQGQELDQGEYDTDKIGFNADIH